jgi:hypothetical protein
MTDAKKPLPQDMVDQDKKKGYESDPFVKLRKKIFGETKAVEDTEMCGGGKVKKMAKGGSASARADGCAVRGKTRGTIV